MDLSLIRVCLTCCFVLGSVFQKQMQHLSSQLNPLLTQMLTSYKRSFEAATENSYVSGNEQELSLIKTLFDQYHRLDKSISFHEPLVGLAFYAPFPPPLPHPDHLLFFFFLLRLPVFYMLFAFFM
jgi:hypothetical protein